MKKVFALLITGALVLSLGVTCAFAASRPQSANYVDENKDGACNVCGFADTNGDGVCDSCPDGGVCPQDGTGRRADRGNAGSCSGFVDADGDGVCDSCPGGGVCPQDGTGAQRGRMCGQSR